MVFLAACLIFLVFTLAGGVAEREGGRWDKVRQSERVSTANLSDFDRLGWCCAPESGAAARSDVFVFRFSASATSSAGRRLKPSGGCNNKTGRRKAQAKRLAKGEEPAGSKQEPRADTSLSSVGSRGPHHNQATSSTSRQLALTLSLSLSLSLTLSFSVLLSLSLSLTFGLKAPFYWAFNGFDLHFSSFARFSVSTEPKLALIGSDRTPLCWSGLERTPSSNLDNTSLLESS